MLLKIPVVGIYYHFNKLKSYYQEFFNTKNSALSINDLSYINYIPVVFKLLSYGKDLHIWRISHTLLATNIKEVVYEKFAGCTTLRHYNQALNYDVISESIVLCV